jgi:hypothetical protein
MELPNSLLTPALALIGWTLVMLVWLYATRIPAMAKLKIDPQEAARSGQKPELPPSVSRVADNYNHLHEQPTLFYATAIIGHLALPGGFMSGDPIAWHAAWAFVGLRILHSLIQATVNIIVVRFLVFNLSAIVLGVLLWRVGAAVLAL